MLHDILENLTQAQRVALFERKMEPPLISAWRAGRRLPTEVQVADLADVTGADWAELQKEVTVLRAPEDRREQIARAIKWRKR